MGAQFSPCPPAKFSLAPGLVDQLPPLPPNHRLSAHPTILPAPADPTHGRWTDMDWRYYLYCYQRQVEMVDAEIGRIVAALEQSAAAQDTLLVFASDHGDGRAQHYHYGKDCILDPSVMAPLVIVHPELAGRRDTAHIVSSIDVTATLCDYAEVDPLPGRRGLSLRPLLEGRSAPWRRYAASTTAKSRERIIRTASHKLLHDRVTNEYVLYDLARDPWEMNNLAGDPAESGTLAQLKAYMDENDAACRYAPQTVRMLELWERERRRGVASLAGIEGYGA